MIKDDKNVQIACGNLKVDQNVVNGYKKLSFTMLDLDPTDSKKDLVSISLCFICTECVLTQH
jgi:hypothetical protein